MLQKRYNSLDKWLKERFGCKVFKVSLDTGGVCPNRQGTLNGCIFCNEESYATTTGTSQNDKSLQKTLLSGIEYIKKRHRAEKFISYFQGGTNTYGPIEKLGPIFMAAIDHPDIVGLSIGTRPDCVTKEYLDLFELLSKKTMLSVEIGLQSANNKTLKLINRGHSAEDFSNTANLLKQRGVQVIAHVILGLPQESIGEMLNTARFLNMQSVSGVKIHNLHVLKGTELEQLYYEGNIEIPSLATYAEWVCDFLEELDPSIIIHRVNGHAHKHLTVAPEWSINKLAIFNAVEKRLIQRDSWQGKNFTAELKSQMLSSANQDKQLAH